MSEKIQARIEPATDPAAEQRAGHVALEPEKPASAADPASAANAANAAEPTPAAAGDAREEGAFARASRWLAETFPNSRHAVIGGLIGLLVAILLFTIGLIKTLVIAILVTVGVACGQYVDGDPKLVRIVEKLIKKH